MGNLSLIMVLAFLVGYSYMGFRVRSTQEDAMSGAVNAMRKVQLKLLCASGANRGLSELTQLSTYRTSIGGALNGGNFWTRIYDRSSDATLPSSQLRLMVSVNVGPYVDTSYVLLQFPSFSRFAYISNNEQPSGSPIYFVTGDTIRGPVHTNTYFSMMGTPAFLSSVSSSLYYNGVANPYQTSGTTNPYFAETPLWGMPAMPLPTTLDSQRVAAAAAGTSYTDLSLYVQFNADGTYSTKTSSAGTWTVRTRPTNGMIYVGPASGTSTSYNVYVSGTVKGRYTVASSGNINITGDIVYQSDPRTNAASTDMLGLVALQNCVLQNNVASGNRTIMAHIMTMNATATTVTSNFYNQDYSTISSGTLTIYGGLAQARRGAVGQSGTPRMGYLKNYQYDNRLLDTSPPGYPLTTVLQQIYYWE